jgi:ATPase family associated with various cellular activities (AAA)
MFSLTHGRMIAKTNTHPINVISILDPDQIKPIIKKGAGRPKVLSKKILKKKKLNYRVCGGKHTCCRYCHEEFCLEEPCCNECGIYYDIIESSDSDSALESDESEPEEEQQQILGKEYIPSPRAGKLIPLPNFEERFVEYVSGPSGSGKSTIASQLASQFKNMYPHKPIYIFSRTEAKNDPAFHKLKPIQIQIDESMIENPIDITKEVTEGGCLMIFDDCNTIHNEKVKKEVDKLMADAMEVGRKLNCNIIITNHLVIPNEKKFARTMLNEMNMLTIFPKSGSSQQIRYALKTYYGLNNKQIDKILSLSGRWVRISKTYPQYVLHEQGAYIL